MAEARYLGGDISDIIGGPDVLLGALECGRRFGDMSLKMDLEQSFREDSAVVSAMRVLENPDGLNSEIAEVIRNLLRKVFEVYVLKRENGVLRDAVADLKVAASIDGLTGLLNQQTFRAYGGRMFTHEVSNGGRISYVMGDVDKFKLLNDRYGHAAGDEVLRSVGSVIRETVRDFDVAGRDGGEEFGIVLPRTGLDGACSLAERLRRRIEAISFNFEGGSPVVTMSFGVAVRDSADRDFDELRRRADSGLYSAKNEHGRNAVVLSSVSRGGVFRCISSDERVRYDDGSDVSDGADAKVVSLFKKGSADV